METINGEWFMHGVRADDPLCIHTVRELEMLIEEIGFLPLFGNEIPGFSVEERTVPEAWWSDDESRDPWMWRTVIARNGRIAYGKFFNRKAGFISKKWFPSFANACRDGYDFDARWDDEKASLRSRKIMDLFAEENRDRELFSFEIKAEAGFGKNGEKNFDGTLTDLEMQTYLLVRDFRQKKNKAGKGYGWHVAVYCTPEHLWGYEHVTSKYSEDPELSAKAIFDRVKEVFPGAEPEAVRKVLGARFKNLP